MATTAKKESHSREMDNTVACPVVSFPSGKQIDRCNNDMVAEYQRSGDAGILEEILCRNEGLIHAVLKRFSYFPDPYEDIVQVAKLGMIKAVRRFEGTRGIAFSSYATAVMDGEVRHYLRDNVLVRQPRWLRKSEKRIEDATLELSRKLNRSPSLKEIAEEVNITEEGILEIFRIRASTGLQSIDGHVETDNFTPRPDYCVFGSLHYESFSLPIEDSIILHQAFSALSAFQRKIVYLLFYKDLTQMEVAEEMGLSQRKVSRESAKALGRLKAILNKKIF